LWSTFPLSIKAAYNDNSNILNNYFAPVFTTEILDNVPVMNESPYPCMADITITLDGLFHLLQNLKTHKACGPDGIPIRLLKETSEEVAPILLLIFRASLKQ